MSSYSKDSFDANESVFRQISEIIPNKLYLTSEIGARRESELLNLGIKLIVSIMHYRPPITHLHKFRIRHKYLFSNDDEKDPIHRHFRHFYHLMNHTKGAVLVHCQMGMSRSATLVISYLIKGMIEGICQLDELTYTDSVEKVIEWVQDRRPIVEPNSGFEQRLITLQKQLLSKFLL